MFCARALLSSLATDRLLVRKATTVVIDGHECVKLVRVAPRRGSLHLSSWKERGDGDAGENETKKDPKKGDKKETKRGKAKVAPKPKDQVSWVKKEAESEDPDREGREKHDRRQRGDRRDKRENWKERGDKRDAWKDGKPRSEVQERALPTVPSEPTLASGCWVLVLVPTLDFQSSIDLSESPLSTLWGVGDGRCIVSSAPFRPSCAV